MAVQHNRKQLSNDAMLLQTLGLWASATPSGNYKSFRNNLAVLADGIHRFCTSCSSQEGPVVVFEFPAEWEIKLRQGKLPPNATLAIRFLPLQSQRDLIPRMLHCELSRLLRPGRGIFVAFLMWGPRSGLVSIPESSVPSPAPSSSRDGIFVAFDMDAIQRSIKAERGLPSSAETEPSWVTRRDFWNSSLLAEAIARRKKEQISGGSSTSKTAKKRTKKTVSPIASWLAAGKLPLQRYAALSPSFTEPVDLIRPDGSTEHFASSVPVGFYTSSFVHLFDPDAESLLRRWFADPNGTTIEELIQLNKRRWWDPEHDQVVVPADRLFSFVVCKSRSTDSVSTPLKFTTRRTEPVVTCLAWYLPPTASLLEQKKNSDERDSRATDFGRLAILETCVLRKWWDGNERNITPGEKRAVFAAFGSSLSQFCQDLGIARVEISLSEGCPEEFIPVKDWWSNFRCEPFSLNSGERTDSDTVPTKEIWTLVV